MDLLRPEELRALTELPDGDRISMFMPTERAWPEAQQNPVRLRNLLGRAQEALLERGLRRPEADGLLAPAAALVDDQDYWRYQGDGLAVFLSQDVNRTYRLPLDLQEQVVVGDRFSIKPLLPLLTGDGRFLVLALSQDQSRLLQGSKQSVEELEIDVPQGLRDLLVVHRDERQLQWHTGAGAPPRGGRRPAVFHGHGTGKEPDDELLRKYLRRIDEGIREALPDERTPLVVAAVEHLRAMYREVSDYDNLLEQGVDGNPDDLGANDLHRKAWQVMEPYFHGALGDAAARYREAVGTGLATSGIEGCLRAAHEGRIDTLWVAAGAESWGTFDDSSLTPDVHDESKPGDQDLLDLAAAQTLLHAGTVYSVAENEVPGEPPVAALLRF